MDDPDNAKGPASGAEFRLSVEEPTKDFAWTAGMVVLASGFTLFKGGLTGTTVLVLVAILAIAYVSTLHDEETAEGDRSVKLRIDAEGVAIPAMLRQTVPWDAIKLIRGEHHKGSSTLRLVLNDPEGFGQPPQTGMQRFLWGEGVTYNVTALEGGWDTIVWALRRYGPDRLTGDL